MSGGDIRPRKFKFSLFFLPCSWRQQPLGDICLQSLRLSLHARSWQMLSRGPFGDRIARSSPHKGPDLTIRVGVEDRIAKLLLPQYVLGFWGPFKPRLYALKSSKRQPKHRKTDFKTVSLHVAKILSPVARQAPTKRMLASWLLSEFRRCWLRVLLHEKCGWDRTSQVLVCNLPFANKIRFEMMMWHTTSSPKPLVLHNRQSTMCEEGVFLSLLSSGLPKCFIPIWGSLTPCNIRTFFMNTSSELGRVDCVRNIYSAIRTPSIPNGWNDLFVKHAYKLQLFATALLMWFCKELLFSSCLARSNLLVEQADMWRGLGKKTQAWEYMLKDC